MTAYYNEIDPFAAAWLRNLITAGHIAPGDVDERSIEDVRPDDLAGFTQCHFFAGIGVWSYALRSAGWPDDRPVWTGSCPCQPFSNAGQGGGFTDERHLWPALHHLIRECRPAVVVGEQVASKDGLGWLDLVQADLEGVGYACGPVVTPAAGYGAPHERHRLYWVAHADVQRQQGFGWRWQTGITEHRETFGVAVADCAGRNSGGVAAAAARHRNSALPDGGGDKPCPTNGFWRDADWLRCRDGKFRPVEPGTFPLADRPAARVERLRAYGNAIVAPQAIAFVESAMGF